MANININELTLAIGITGAEYVPCVQAGVTKRFPLGLVLGASASATTQAANSFLAGPTSGDNASPFFRAIVPADIPSATISGILDNIGSTQGMVLFRGASQWQTLATSTSGYVLSTQGPGADPLWIPNTAGSVTSVGLALPASVFSVTNSPVTTTGTLTGSFVTQTANTAFMGPTTGAAATPAFRAFVNADINVAGVALTKVDDTNVTLTLGGAPTTALLNATSITAGWTGQLSLTRGGSNASLTASNGGIIYSTASAMAVLSGTATAGQHLQSGSNAAPSWTTTTFPSTSAAGTVLASLTANTVTASATPTLGIAGTTLGTLSLCGNTSGTVILTPQAAAGTPTLTFPNASGTFAVSATAPITLNATTGAIGITGSALTKVDDTNVTLTLGGTPATALLVAASITAGWTGQLAVGRGGTGLSTFTSNVIYKGNTTSALAASSITDNGTAVVGTEPFTAPNFAGGYTTTATAAGTTTLTIASTQFQFFTGSTTQTVVLPVTSTLFTGLSYTVVNNSTGVVTVQSSGANTVLVMGPQSVAQFICILTSGTTAASWAVQAAYANVPQNSQSAAYTTVLSDAGKHILHPTADNNARTFTIDSNANVPYPIGTALTFVNQIDTVTISITSDTLTLAGAGTTGSRTLAANGIATALKIASTNWIISGTGLT